MKLTLSKIICTAVVVCTAVWTVNAAGVNDGGFEASADGIGAHPFSAAWTLNDPSGFSNVGGDSAFAHSGDNYANLGSTPGTGTLSPAGGLSGLVLGQFYTLSFWLANDITVGLPSGNSFQVSFLGNPVFSLTNQAAFGYTQFTISNVQYTGNNGLVFTYNHNNDFWRLDDIMVTGQGVPEAFSTIWLALPAFGALGLLHFSRARGRKSLAHI